jgi:glutamate-1-semialdehyde 2,1-aminomutase
VDHRSLFVKSGQGARVTDADGRSYIDYMMGFGALILGHRPAPVIDAIRQSLDTGTMFGAACDAELELAEKVVACLPCAEMTRFTSSGTEAVMAALRLARAATGRDKVLKFEGHFHGWADATYISVKPVGAYGLPDHPTPLRMTAGQPKSVLDDVVVAPWNDLTALENILNSQARDIAALILEPYPTNNGCMDSEAAYLVGLRDLCTRHGIVLIFDEVVSGFRMGLGGAQAHYGVTPDLCTFGKAMAAGMPIAGFAGRRDLMELLEGNRVAHLGTNNSNAISAAAAVATIDTLAQDGGAAFARIANYGRDLCAGFNEVFARHGLPLCADGHGAVFSVFASKTPPQTFRETLTHNSLLLVRLHQDLLHERIWIFGRGTVMISDAHGADERDETLEKLDKVVKHLANERKIT